jgi:trk system potassium uptake protein
MRVVILGSGRVGARLATLLDEEGNEVTIVDMDPSSFRRLGPGYRGQVVTGTGIDQDVLKTAGIEHADVFIAVTNGDNTNVMAAQTVMLIFKVPKVIARIYDPVRAETYRQLGIETVCSTIIMSDRIKGLITG